MNKCIAITLEESTIDIIIGALTDKMSRINTFAILSGVKNEKVMQEHTKCEKALGLFNKAKENINTAKIMAKEIT